jgi:hypothetical protein
MGDETMTVIIPIDLPEPSLYTEGPHQGDLWQ